MPDTLRVRLEAVLRFRFPDLYARDPGGERNWDNITAILDHLCAAVHEAAPQPSREALSAILGGHCSQVELLQCLYDKLLAWARGEPEPRRWCNHCVWDTEGDYPTCSNPDYQHPHWCFQESGMKPTPVRPNWTVCPICGQPRPSEPA